MTPCGGNFLFVIAVIEAKVVSSRFLDFMLLYFVDNLLDIRKLYLFVQNHQGKNW